MYGSTTNLAELGQVMVLWRPWHTEYSISRSATTAQEIVIWGQGCDGGSKLLWNVRQYLQDYMLMAGPIGRAVWGVGLDRLDAETMGSNPA
jgi:hypothetical protein